MPTDRFASYINGIGAPYTDAVALVPSDDEIEPTAALMINTASLLTVVPLDRDTPVTLRVAPGLLALRIRKLTSMYVSGFAGANTTGLADDVPVVVGLY